MSSVFISYNSLDIDKAQQLENFFLEKGVKVWRDENKLRPGNLIIEEISSAIESIDYVVALISKNSIKSPWVEREISLALTREIEARKPIVIPVLLDDCKIPSNLRNKVYADLRIPEDYDKESLDDTYARRQIVCDESAKYSNQFILGKSTAIMANPKSGGYTETSVFKDSETVDVLVREFDHQFHNIRKQRMCVLIQEKKCQRELLLREVICALDGQRPV